MTELTDRIRDRAAELKTQERRIDVLEDPDVPVPERIQQRRMLLEQGVNVPSPKQIDIQQRRQKMAAQVGETVLGPAGFEDFGKRFDIGLSDIFIEKRAKFMEAFPEGDFIEVNDPAAFGREGGKTILFRRNQNEPFAEFDAIAQEKFELVNDLADLSSELPAAVLELLVTRGGGLLRQMLQIGGATVVGEGMKEAVEEMRGFQKEEILPIVERSLLKGVVSMAGGAATTLVSGPINAFRGSANLSLIPGSRAAQQAARDLGIPALMPHQIALNPLVQKIGGQAQQTVSSVRQYIIQQQGAMVRTLTGLRDQDAARYLRGDLQNLHDDAIKQILTALKVTRTSLKEGGSALQRGIAEYDDLANTAVNRLYLDARGIEEPNLSVTAAKDVAAEVKAFAEKLGSDGGPVAKLANDILELDPALPPQTIELPSGEEMTISAVDQLRFLRSQAFDLKTPNPGEIARAKNKFAGKLFGALDHSLKKPKNASPEFLEAWGKAQTEAAKRFSTMEKVVIRQAMRDETPTKMAARLAKPLEVDNLRFLKSTVSESAWRRFQQAALSDMVAPQNVQGLTKRLQAFDKETLDVLVSKPDQATLRQIGLDVDRLQTLGISDVLEKQAQDMAVVDALFARKDTAAIGRLASMIEKQPGGKAQRSIRAGLMERAYNNIVRRSQGVGEAINPKAIEAEIKTLRETGAIRLLTPDDVRTLENLDRLAPFVPADPDSGTSLVTASTAAGVRGFATDAFITLLENVGTGRLLTSPKVARLIVGGGRARVPFNKLRVMGAVLAQSVADIEGE